MYLEYVLNNTPIVHNYVSMIYTHINDNNVNCSPKSKCSTFPHPTLTDNADDIHAGYMRRHQDDKKSSSRTTVLDMFLN